MNDITQLLAALLATVALDTPIALLALVAVTAITEIRITTLGVIDAVLLFTGYEYGMLSFQALLVLAALTLGRRSVVFGNLLVLASIPAAISEVAERTFAGSQCPAGDGGTSAGQPPGNGRGDGAFTPGLLLPASVASGMFHVKHRSFVTEVML